MAQAATPLDSLLESMDLDFVQPLDSDYKDYQLKNNPFFHCDYAIRSRREDMEIRYAIRPYQTGSPTTQHPNLTVFSALSSAATNEEEAIIAQIAIPKKELQEVFGADWGKMYQFTPKPGFSSAPFGRLLGLYKEEVGLVLVFFLFDDPNNPAIDLRYPAVYFND